MQIFTEKYQAGANTHKLSVAVFASILAATLSFLGAFHYFNHVYRSIFSEISTYTNTAIVNSELNRRFMDLELDVRNLLTIVLRAPEQVADFHRNLRDDFAALQKLVNESEEIRIKEQVHEELDTYQNFLDRLLQDYSMLNVELQSINTFFETYKLALEQLQEKIGNAIVETTLAEQNAEGLLQAFVLVPLCDEEFLNSHSQLRSSIANYTPSLLGVVIDDAHQEDFSKTTLGHLATMEKTLRTMTSADAPIGPTIKNMVKILPEYRDNIKRLHDILVSSMAHYEEFIIARDVILISLEDVDQIGSDGIKNIQMLAKRHEKQEYYLSFLISALIMTVALAGFLLTRRAAKQLNTVVKDIVEAKEQQQEMNVQLKQEIAERLKAEKLLSLARDDLEIRVEQRTTELFNSNLLLQDEIKERLKTQKDLEAERERLLVTLKSIGDAVIATDTRGNILLLNQMAEKLTGWNQVDAVGKPLQEVFHVIHGQSHRSVKNPVEHVLAAGSVIGLADQVILVDRKGRGKNIADSCAPIRDSNGEIIGVVLVFRDITEHLKTEAELLKIKKLESIGVLAGGIAHDFNNILAAILGNINLASFDNELKESTRALLSEAEKASLRAKDLTQQLLTFAKGGEPVKEVSSLERVIIDSASFVLRGDKVACRYEIPEDLWMVNIDKGQISQVIQNIVLNASHAMPEGGVISITCENCFSLGTEVKLHAPEGRYVKISIQDNGIGIPAEIIEKIFDPYFSTKQHGSGLGLAITQSIINRHNGYLSVQSTPGAGATFTVYLPASEMHLAQQAEASVPHQSFLKARILVMDDEEMVRDVAKRMLVYLGHEVVLTKDGDDTVKSYRDAIAANTPFDLVIMDLTIPGGMGGKEAVKKILAINPQAKVVVSSGYSNDPILAHFKEYGFSEVIVKPYQLLELSRVLSQLKDTKK